MSPSVLTYDNAVSNNKFMIYERDITSWHQIGRRDAIASSSSISQSILSYGSIRYSAITPPDGYCFHGAFVSYTGESAFSPDETREQIKKFTNMIGKGLYLYSIAGGLWWYSGENIWMINHKCLIDEGLIKAIAIAINPADPQHKNEDYWTVQEIANGQWDDLIRKFASQVKSFEYPIFIRFGGEMNLAQGVEPWQFSFGKNPDDYVAAWRRFVNIFRNEGVSNAIFVWNPNWKDMGPHHWTEYYPGDAYVDWVGIDLYQYQPDSDPDKLMEGVYNDYFIRKPIMIAEWGANWEGQNYSDSSRAEFISKFFDAVEARPKIKLINYWYIADFIFDPETHPRTTEAYKSNISKSRYIIQNPRW
jgi:hypothetical protein